ncbi:MAG TPA: succinate--CoA ligase subunit beta, partial [Methylophaga sp.]|nr:succinate--CoA ligase subunit beta [Methylophaga sp.]
MNLHEYQAKQLFNQYGIATPKGRMIATADEVESAITAIGGDRWVVKAQVHSGGRGKAGGVRVEDNQHAVKDAVNAMLGSQLVTHQTTAEGLPVNKIWIETPSSIARELYLALLVDRVTQRVVFMISAEGGMDIEEVAEKTPKAILNLYVDPVAGLQFYQCRQAGFFLQLTGAAFKQLQQLMQNLYQLFCEKDISLLEINPLVVTDSGDLLALDAKINVDDNALYRHTDLAELFDPSQENPAEVI